MIHCSWWTVIFLTVIGDRSLNNECEICELSKCGTPATRKAVADGGIE